MPQVKSPTKPLPSFVRLKTTPDMRALALKLAKMKRANAGIGKIEAVLRNSSATDEMLLDALRDLRILSGYNAKTADEAIALLKSVKQRVEKYNRSL